MKKMTFEKERDTTIVLEAKNIVIIEKTGQVPHPTKLGGKVTKYEWDDVANMIEMTVEDNVTGKEFNVLMMFGWVVKK